MKRQSMSHGSAVASSTGKQGAQLIPSMIGRGLSANAGLAELKAKGIGIRRQTFLDLWRMIIKEMKTAAALAMIDPNTLPTGDMMTSVTGRGGLGYSYRIVFKVPTGEEREEPSPTNVYETQWRGGFSRALLTPNEAISAYEQAASAEDYLQTMTASEGAYVDRVFRFSRT